MDKDIHDYQMLLAEKCDEVISLNNKIKLMDELLVTKVQKIVNMRKECNKRFAEQLQKIRKLEAEKMLQIQEVLFKDNE